MKKRQIPHTYAIIFYIILFCAALTWIIPGGQYKESINAAGEKTVVYEAVEHVPQTWQVFSAFYKGFVDKADIIVFILIIGGAFWIVNDSKAFDIGTVSFLGRARKMENNRFLRKEKLGNGKAEDKSKQCAEKQGFFGKHVVNHKLFGQRHFRRRDVAFVNKLRLKIAGDFLRIVQCRQIFAPIQNCVKVKIVCRSFSSKIACCAFHAYPRNSGGDKNLFPCTCVEIKTGNSRATYTLTVFDDSSSI